MIRAIGSLFLCVLALSCRGAEPHDDESFFRAMLSSSATLRGVAAEPCRYRLQIIVGEIDEDDATIRWRIYRGDAEYFYPASTVKLPVAALALNELRRLSIEHDATLTVDTPLAFDPLFEGETIEAEDPTNLEGGAITVGHDIRKIMLVSDNAAFNRLYELVGHQRINEALHDAAGLTSTMLTHRLSEYRTAEQNRRSPVIRFRTPGRVIIIGERTSEYRYDARLLSPDSIPLGRGYAARGEIVPEPMEFADNNRMSLMDLLVVVQSIVRPDLEGGDRLGLHEHDRAFLRQAMGELPRESSNPRYAEAEYPDGWGKLFLPGVRRVLPPERVKVYNKIGRAYGTSTDVAYIEDEATGRGVFLGVTIYTNDNAILNDNRYEYESLADPVMADIAAYVADAILINPGSTP
ncbi:MAG: serine hydrolase [Phycisphaerales bacterium]